MPGASRFLWVDLSPNARDFEGIALEPGLPLLDQPNANYRILQRWLGRFVAEPQRNGDAIDFYVCDDQQARLEDVRCSPATIYDLRRIRGLEQELGAIGDRLKKIKPTTPAETKLLDVLTRQFQKLTSKAPDVHSQLFKYQQFGKWHLAWAWGYQPKDLAPATSIICTDPNCALLFLKKNSESRACPACKTAADIVATGKKRRPVRALGVVAVVILLLGVLSYSLRDKLFPSPTAPKSIAASEAGLFAKPASWSVPVGARIEFTLMHRDAQGIEKDVTNQVVPIVEDPAVLRLDPVGLAGQVRRPGKTVAHFYLADLEARATVEVAPPTNPAKIVVEPNDLTLGVGATGRLRVWGEFAGEKRVDLTEAAEWEPPPGGGVFCHQGRLEGLFKGTNPITAKYRATETAPYLKAEATVKVVDQQYQSLELAIKPPVVRAGSASSIDVFAIDATGSRCSVLNSSQLKLWVSPSGLGAVRDDYLQGISPGRGRLFATFQNLSNSVDFEISSDDGARRLTVRPKDLELAVGETSAFTVTGSTDSAILSVSAAPEVAEIVEGNRIIGRSPGQTLVTVSQGAQRDQMRIKVAPVEIKEISFVPSRAVVLVDGSMPLRLVGRSNQLHEFDLSPDQLEWERLPTASFADLDIKNLRVTGTQPTGEQPQQAIVRFGQLRATLLIDVVAAPVRVELSPAGPIELPVGTSRRFTAWANYRDNRRIELPPERLTWGFDPASVSGLELVAGTGLVRATKPGIESARIYAIYQGSKSEPVELKTIKLKNSIVLRADRKVIVVGQSGALAVSLANTEAAADATLENVKFTSSDPKTLTVDPHTGAYRALAAGEVTVTANHPSATSGTSMLKCVEPGEVTLELRPASIKLPINGRQKIELVLKTVQDEETISLNGGNNVELSISQPDAVRWNPPFLQGITTAKPFELTASYAGKTARGTVEVVSAKSGDAPFEIRIVPAIANLTPGQSLSPAVEQRIPASDEQWREVAPERIQWKVPVGVLWTPPRGDLRPQLVLTETPSDASLEAEYSGAKATMKITINSDHSVSGPLAVLREPDGETLAVGSQQRYAIGVDKDSQLRSAANVLWQPAFENEFVRWEPPVLYAKRAGHEQRLTATVGGQHFAFNTRIVDSLRAPLSEPPRDDSKPESVRIVTDQPQPIIMPLRGEFRDFRVEATFVGGQPPLDVTRQATLRVSSGDSDNPPVAVDAGRLTGQRVGKAEVLADYHGISSSEGLPIEVTDQISFSALEIEPAKIELRPYESTEVKVKGFSGKGADRKAAGDVAAIAGLEWRSANPDIVRVNGPIVTAIKAGKSAISVNSGNASATAEVIVVEASSAADVPAVEAGSATDVPVVGTDEKSELPGRLFFSPDSLRLNVGETKWLGKDVMLRRGSADLIQQIQGASSSPSIVRYNNRDQSVEGIAPGRAEITVVAGDQRLSLPVLVEAVDGSSEGGEIVVEPAIGQLNVGQAQELHVYLISKIGSRIDRTNSADFESSNPAILAATGNRVTAVAAGQAEILVQLPGIKGPGKAVFSVRDETFTAIEVFPPVLNMGIGDEEPLRIVGIGPGGRRDLGNHPDLTVTVAGETPNAVQVRNARNVRAVSPGAAQIEVRWRNLAAPSITVNVSGEPLEGLRVEPLQTTVDAGKQSSFRVYGRRGNREKALTSEDGVTVEINDPRVAKAGPDLVVTGIHPGTTEVCFKLGSQRAVAKLTVNSGAIQEPPPSARAKSLRFIPDHLSLELGLPPARARLVKVLADGTEQDVDRVAEVTFANPAIVDMSWTPGGPAFVGKTAGRTEATASLDGMTTPSPLAISVVDVAGSPLGHAQPELRVRPDPLTLTVGGVGEFRSVQIVPATGGTPIDVDYRIETKDPKIVVVDGKTLRGIAAGQTEVAITAMKSGTEQPNLTMMVAVQVVGGEDRAADHSELVLTGPLQTTVGAEVRYVAELISSGKRQDVTHDATTLVLDQDQIESAKLQPGCVLVANRPGVISVRARRNDQISNVLSLRIDSVSTNFVRLELEIERRPLLVGEKRSYKIWGDSAEGMRQDLTLSLIGEQADPAHERPKVAIREVGSSGTAIVSHSPPTLVAKAPGRFQIGVAIGKELRSEIVTLEILESQKSDTENIELKASPEMVTLRVGESTPEISVNARDVVGGSSRPVDVHWTSEDESVAAPDPRLPGRFLCRTVGKTILKGKYGGQQVSVPINILGNQFDQVRLDPRAIWKSGSEFQVVARILGTRRGGSEYRLVAGNHRDQDGWKAATIDGESLKVELISPVLKLGPAGTEYGLTIECRDKESHVEERYPLSFKLAPGIVEQQRGADGKSLD